MRAVTRQALSVGIATSAYAISFGAVSVAAGLTVWQTVVMSALLFTGGSQFALVGVLGAGGSGVAAVATSTLLGVRNGLYALQVSRILQVRGLRRLLAAQLTIDESTAVAIGQTDPQAMRARVLADRRDRLRWAGTSRRWPAHSSGTRSVTRRCTASTRPPRRRSAPCSGRGCGPWRPVRPRRWPRC